MVITRNLRQVWAQQLSFLSNICNNKAAQSSRKKKECENIIYMCLSTLLKKSANNESSRKLNVDFSRLGQNNRFLQVTVRFATNTKQTTYLTITFWKFFSTGSNFKQCLNKEQYLDHGRLADIVPMVVTASVTRLCSLAAVWSNAQCVTNGNKKAVSVVVLRLCC